MQWYLSQDGKTSGPFSEQRIEMLVNWGKVSSEAYLCDDKWSCWVSITRSHFAPILAAYLEHADEGDATESAFARPSQYPSAESTVHRLALVLLIMLAAAAFALALYLSPDGAPGPIGTLLQEDVRQLWLTLRAVAPIPS